MAKTKRPTYQELARQNMELRAQLAFNYAAASKDIDGASTRHMKSSGVLLQIHALGGREIVKPVLVRDGLSDDTIAALKKDFRLSWELATVAKP